MLTEKQYEDFILRFEFKLEDGSNNGLAIRSPLKPDSLAYEGMEIQIIDDQSERYKKIQTLATAWIPIPRFSLQDGSPRTHRRME